MLKYFIISIVATLFLSASQASAETMPMNKNMNNTMHQQKTMQECESEMTTNKAYSKEECVKYKMMQKNMMSSKMMKNRGMMMGRSGMMPIFCIITLVLSWVLMTLGIVALWKWIKMQK